MTSDRPAPNAPSNPAGCLHRVRLAQVLSVALATLAFVPCAQAKEAVDLFGQRGRGVTVNSSGAGPADAGDVYVASLTTQRIERYGRDDNGTPADPTDDTYFFISAWGADVVKSGGSGDVGDAQDADFEICTVASECKAGIGSPGNGSVSGDGSLDLRNGSGNSVNQDLVAVDQDTGEVYVSDMGNHRVNVYAGDGTFLRSFGHSVTQSGPGNVASPDEVQELTVKATGAKFSLEFEGEATGARSIGGSVSSESKLVRGLAGVTGSFEVGQGLSTAERGGPGAGPNSFPRGTTIAALEGAGLIASQAATDSCCGGGYENYVYGSTLPHDASAKEVEDALNALPTIGGAGGSVTVSGGPGSESGSTPYTIAFDGGSFVESDLPQIRAVGDNLTNSGGSPEANVTTASEGGAYEVCVAADGDVCRVGSVGAGEGSIDLGTGIAVSDPDGNPASGTVYLADAARHRVATFGLDGSGPGTIGSPAEFEECAKYCPNPAVVAVDSRGILYISNRKNQSAPISRYDTEDANGEGVGFLAPIPAGVDERQKVKIAASAGTFRLGFDPDGAGPLPAETTIDMPFNWPAKDSGPPNPLVDSVQDALQALPSLAGDNVYVSGGPGDAGSSKPYEVWFRHGYGAKDVAQLTVSNGSVPLSGGSGASVETTVQGQAGLIPGVNTSALAVDPDEDGAGPEADTLYVARGDTIQQFGPLHAPGLSAAPLEEDERHGVRAGFDGTAYNGASGLAVDTGDGRLYVPAALADASGVNGVFVLDDVGPAPTVSLDSLDEVGPHGLTAHVTIDPNGPPDSSYRLEYSADGGAGWESTASTPLGHQEDPQQVSIGLEPLPVGLEPNTAYQVRVVVERRFAPPVTSNALGATTGASPPAAETTGAPLRTTTTARLTGRVTPGAGATTYHFEYGSEGPCDANPCASTPTRAAGSDNLAHLVAEEVTGLEANTTYHYRVVADNGNPGSPVTGGDMTVSTRSSEGLPDQNEAYPGPPGSDRAWELVSMADSGGNPVGFVQGFSDSGDRSVYTVFGGTPISSSGSAFSYYFSERPLGAHPSTGWHSKLITPPREDLVGPNWGGLFGASDLSSNIAANDTNLVGPIWRLSPDEPAESLFKPTAAQELVLDSTVFGASADGRHAVAFLSGSSAIDPAYPAAAGVGNLYDVSSSPPRLVSLLPGDEPAPCGAAGFALEMQGAHWISADGSLVYFRSAGSSCGGQPQPVSARRPRRADEADLRPGPVGPLLRSRTAQSHGRLGLLRHRHAAERRRRGAHRRQLRQGRRRLPLPARRRRAGVPDLHRPRTGGGTVRVDAGREHGGGGRLARLLPEQPPAHPRRAAGLAQHLSPRGGERRCRLRRPRRQQSRAHAGRQGARLHLQRRLPKPVGGDDDQRRQTSVLPLRRRRPLAYLRLLPEERRGAALQRGVRLRAHLPGRQPQPRNALRRRAHLRFRHLDAAAGRRSEHSAAGRRHRPLPGGERCL